MRKHACGRIRAPSSPCSHCRTSPSRFSFSVAGAAAGQSGTGCGVRTGIRPQQPSLGEPLLEQRHPVVAPERLAAKHEDRNAEDVVARSLLLAGLELGGPAAGEILAI